MTIYSGREFSLQEIEQIKQLMQQSNIATRDLAAVRPDLAVRPWPIRVRALGGLRIEINAQSLAFKGKVAKKPLELLLFVSASSGVEVSVGRRVRTGLPPR